MQGRCFQGCELVKLCEHLPAICVLDLLWISRKTKQTREIVLYVQQASVCRESSDAAGKQLSQKIVWKFCQHLLDWVAQPPTLKNDQRFLWKKHPKNTHLL